MRGQKNIGAGAAVLFVGEQEVAYAAHFLPNEHRVNVAEYTGLIVGLELALKLGYRDVKVFGDSELVVRHVLDKYKCRAEHLKPLLARVHELGRQFDRVRIEEAPKVARANGRGPLKRRNSNTRADELAGQCMDARDDMMSRWRQGALRMSDTDKTPEPGASTSSERMEEINPTERGFVEEDREMAEELLPAAIEALDVDESGDDESPEE